MGPRRSSWSVWIWLYRVGGMAALTAVLTGVAEILITFLPGGDVTPVTVVGWFQLLQTQPFMGLRNLGLLNILLNALGIPAYLAMFVALREEGRKATTLTALALSLLGIGVFFATNRALPMLALSREFTAAATNSARAVLEAAGTSMLAVGASHTPGTFPAFALAETAGILVSTAMLPKGIFPRLAGWAGVMGFGCLLAFEVLSSFVTGLSGAALGLSILGGLLSMLWYALVGWTLLRLT